MLSKGSLVRTTSLHRRRPKGAHPVWGEGDLPSAVEPGHLRAAFIQCLGPCRAEAATGHNYDGGSSNSQHSWDPRWEEEGYSGKSSG